eukprot:CAMPEP_0176431506 /NCGR_PEP_ID=MMETSP0127-20121128/14851_1 /TAXON_ID=938130 /ORGANISM="Platyophrya macrostoma, Strain WH" /LENGTH=532 /DNA_ID=CAMNT_0017813523 /DNA_START=24 /DNA_END=1622 /DNA_ORIENTATION=+
MGNKNSTQQSQSQANFQNAFQNQLQNQFFDEDSYQEVPQLQSYNDDEPLPNLVSNSNEKPKVKETESSTIDPDNLFSISLKLKYNTIQINSASETIEPVLCTLKTENTKEGTRVPLDLICVLDTSGSMQGPKIELLRSTLNYLVDLLGEDDRISIVRFSSSAQRLSKLQRVTEANKPGINKIIDTLRASGGTSITAGMQEAVKIITGRRYKNPVTSVFLLSDGLDGGATEGVKSLLKRSNIKDNFTINSFGYGSDHDPKLMSSIAQLKDGKFYFIEKLDTVDECFVNAIGGLVSVVGKDTTINIQAVKSEIFPSIYIKNALGGSELWTMMDAAYNTSISQLSSGKSKNYVLELAIPKCTKTLTDQQKEVVLAKATVCIKLPNTDEVWKKECELKVNLINEDEELPQQEPNKDLLNNYFRVRSAEILSQARTLAEKNDYEGGRKLLQNFREELSQSVVKDELLVKGLLEDIDTTIKEMQPQVYEAVGKHRLYQQVASHMKEESNPFNFNSANMYANCTEQAFVKQAKARKGLF